MGSFSELISGEIPVLVDFYADWCGPCKAMAPELRQTARDLAGTLKVVKVDIDKNPQAAQAYQILGVPTLILFKKGEVVWRQSGAMSAPALITQITPHL